MIVDTFIFNNDFNALKIRLNELNDVVDYFIISESAYSHSGLKKKLFLTENIDVISEFRNKLIIVSDNNKHCTKNPRIREQIQRQNLNSHIKRLCRFQSDLIIHSDCDEIPRAESISQLQNQRNVNCILEMRNFSNALNLEHGTWARCRIVSFNNFKSIQGLRQDIFLKEAFKQKRKNLPFIFVPDYFTTRKFGLWKLPVIAKEQTIDVVPNSGWHFGNLFSADEIIAKIENSCHVELNTPEIRQNAVNNFNEGKDIYRGFSYSRVEVYNTYPKYAINNFRQFKDLIRE